MTATQMHELNEQDSFWWFDRDSEGESREAYTCVCSCGARLVLHCGDDPAVLREADHWLDNGHLHEPGRVTDIYLA